jgi:DNA invertase Pin-like site-specific DNA recombinase
VSAAGGTATRAGILLRVSKDDGSQETENQLLQLQAWAAREPYEVVEVYVDRESGRKGRAERKEFARMLRDAEGRRFDVLLFWSLDRFSREGIRKTLAYLQQLDVCGVRFRSYTEPYLNTDNELIAHIVLGVTAHYAQAEAVRIGERTKAGLARARAQGKTLGRPDGFGRWREDLRAMRDAGDVSKAEMARRTGLSINTVKRYLKRLGTEEASAVRGIEA